MHDTVVAVIVTHQSDDVLPRALAALLASTRPPDDIVVVDSGSSDTAYLDDAEAMDPRIRVLRQLENVGFCVANNIGVRALHKHGAILFLNPDAFVTPGFLEGALDRLAGDPTVGALGPKLLGTSAATMELTGLVDSAGVFWTRYGRPYERGKGEPDRGQYDGPPVDVPGLCAAALLCRTAALDAVADNGHVFDEAFFMYKEDVDLSSRLVAAGWRVVFDSGLVVHHCRGLQRERRARPAWVRRQSLDNDWRLWRKRSVPARVRVPMLGYLLLKSLWLRVEG
jgi:N-acetylglucosaminyl-diphospho-decaprenol L-rhamnosyltransferase